MSQAQCKREWVLEALEQYEGRLTRFALRLLGDRGAAADAVQHTFLRLCDPSPESLQGQIGRASCRERG